MLPIRGLRVVLSLLLISGSSVVSMPLNAYKISLSLAAKFKAAGVTNIAAADRARAQALRQTSVIGKRDADAYMDYFPTVGYSIEVGIGNPAKSYELLVDTASGNTWIGAKQEYTFTNTSTDTQNTVVCTYPLMLI
ncbi:hypothetical protein AZE42_04354 [Rhizopogon vesiculosus]|uniref:Peptidase A1 domain-containing protein n=1 Tax=Rhizopogon vesiculosus TaxID=180088 RepID=A0A1J8RH58_9AGAM|nr:hypothetical protein AZE42_04354 [Rhizopogon vesiculosus]